MKRFIQRILYSLERLFTGGPLVQFLLLFCALLAASVMGGLVMYLFHPRFGASLPQAIWWAFLHLTDTGYMGADNDPFSRVVSVVLTLGGVFLFLGGVVAILTTALNRLLGNLARGQTRVIEDGHLLVIGWNPGLPVLVEELTQAAALLFPRGQQPTLVILSDRLLGSELTRGLPRALRSRARLVTRVGNPLDVASLELVDFLRARSIILLSNRDRVGQRGSDLSVIKIWMSIRARSLQVGASPRVVLDLSHPTNRLLVKSVAGGATAEVVPSLEFAGRLLCQTIRNPGISRVYQQLLTDAFGESLLLIHAADLGATGLTLADLVHRLPGATPLGFMRGRQTCLLDFQQRLRDDDEVVVLATSMDLALASGPGAEWHPNSRPAPLSPGPQRLLVIGQNEALPAMLGELARYTRELYEVTILGQSGVAGASYLGENHRWANLRIHYREGRLRQLEDLSDLPDGDFDRVVLLGAEDRDPLTADAETAMAYALLQQTRLPATARFVVYLHDEDNRDMFLGNGCDVLVTPEISCHMLAQVALKAAWRPLYEELFTSGGAELGWRTWAELAPDPLPASGLTWRDLQNICLAQGLLGLGLEQSDLLLNPGHSQSLTLDPCNRVLVLDRDWADEAPRPEG